MKYARYVPSNGRYQSKCQYGDTYAHIVHRRKRSSIAAPLFLAASIAVGAVVLDNIYCASCAEAAEPEVIYETKYVEVEKTVPAEPVYIKQIEYVAQVEEPAWTDDDLFCLAAVIYQEAGGNACSDEARIAIGNVVMNRVADDRFPDTIREVAEQPYQWGTLYKTGVQFPSRAANAVEAHAVSRAYECARRVLCGERVVGTEVIFASEHSSLGEPVTVIDGIYFNK